MPTIFRRFAFGFFAALWLVAPFVVRHPIFDAFSDHPEPTRLERFIDRIDAELPEDVEVALWWPARDPAGLESLGHLWAQAGYSLAPRRVYPLLTSEEAENLEPLDEALRPFLAARSRALAAARVDVPIAVLSWGEQDCWLEAFPLLVLEQRDGPGCLLRPPRVVESSP